ncbi:MAG: hypothetical protein M3404_00890 [Actinomycetota bacterium]|nr:hypothetical protein [Actinomycetota bacterium]
MLRSNTGWALLSVAITIEYDEHSLPINGSAAVSSRSYSSLVELAAHVADTYVGDAWVQLLDAGEGRDPDLYCAWVPERIRRDFDSASLHRKDLALFTGLINGTPAPAPGRHLPGWREDALDQMAIHLADVGFEVVANAPVVAHYEGGREEPVLGGLRLRRYGWETVGIVRVDPVGEVYIRLPEPEAPSWLLRRASFESGQ